MAYIGNSAANQTFTPVIDTFNGSGSTTAFTLTYPVASVAQVEAYISNVPQQPGVAYTVLGNTITFTSAPPSGTANIYVRYTSPITQIMQPGAGTVGLPQLATNIQDALFGNFRNRIINGAMMIDQRNAGAAFTVGNLGYGIDRFLFQAVAASGTGQQVTGSTGNNKAIRITGAAGNTVMQVSQRIESVNTYDLASQTVTVSFTLYGSTSGSVSVRFLYPTATDNYTSVTEPVAGTTVNFTTTPTTYTVTRTLDANASKGVWALFDFGAVGAGVTRTLEFFQLEKGSTATSFDYRPYGTELALCQRYYYSQAFKVGNYGTTTSGSRTTVYNKVSMRTTPTYALSGETKSNVGTTFVELATTENATAYYLSSSNDMVIYTATMTGTAEL